MFSMSVSDILRKHGKWVEAKEFVALLSREQGISDRHAYRKIKRVWKDGEIKRVVLSDRSVLWGLTEWGAPPKKAKETLSFQEAFLYRCFRDIDEIRKENAEGDSQVAMLKARSLVMKLPPAMKEKLRPDLDKALKRFSRRIEENQPSDPIMRERHPYQEIGAPEVDFLISKISALLHESLKTD